MMNAVSELPHEFDHQHSDVSGGWLRAATFGAMDGLVTNTSLVAGVGGAVVEPGRRDVRSPPSPSAFVGKAISTGA